MTDPTPELLAACRKWLQNAEDDSIENISKSLAAFVQSRVEQAVKLAIEEHEAALCPEDYGCKEYIAYLKKREQAGRLDEAKQVRDLAQLCMRQMSAGDPDDCEFDPDEFWNRLDQRIISLAGPKEPRG